MPTEKTTVDNQTSTKDDLILPVEGNGIVELKSDSTNNNVDIDTSNNNTNSKDDISKDISKDTNATVINDTTSITIDDKDYTLDAQGNAIDPTTGVVFMTKEQIDAVDNTNTSNDLIQQVEAINNFVITDESGNRINYDSTPQGIAKRELDLVNNAKVIGQNEGIQAFLKSNPELQAIYDYKQRYGTIEGFGTKIDYESIQLDVTNKDQLKSFVIEREIALGKSKEDAKAYADFIEKNNQLDTIGATAFNALKQNQVFERQQKDAKFSEWTKSYYGVELDQTGNIKDLNVPNSLYDMIIKKGEFNGLKFPKDGIVIKNGDGTTAKLDKNKLFELAAFADEKGNSQLDNIIYNYLSNAANKLTIGMYILKGGDLSEFAQDALNKQQVKTMKRIISTNKSSVSRDIQSNDMTGNAKDKSQIILAVK